MALTLYRPRNPPRKRPQGHHVDLDYHSSDWMVRTYCFHIPDENINVAHCTIERSDVNSLFLFLHNRHHCVGLPREYMTHMYRHVRWVFLLYDVGDGVEACRLERC